MAKYLSLTGLTTYTTKFKEWVTSLLNDSISTHKLALTLTEAKANSYASDDEKVGVTAKAVKDYTDTEIGKLATVAGSGKYSDLTNIPSTFTPPLASSTVRGGIKIGFTQSGNDYPVKLSSEKAYVTVPVPNVENVLTSTSTTNALSAALGKVLNDKITAIGSAYRVKGTKPTITEVIALTDAKVGDVWNVTAEFTLGGLKYPANTNVVCITATSTASHTETNWDAIGGTVDLSHYITDTAATNKFAPKTHTHTSSLITDFATGVNNLIPIKSIQVGGTTIQASDGVVNITTVPSHNHTVNLITDLVEITADEINALFA